MNPSVTEPTSNITGPYNYDSGQGYILPRDLNAFSSAKNKESQHRVHEQQSIKEAEGSPINTAAASTATHNDATNIDVSAMQEKLTSVIKTGKLLETLKKKAGSSYNSLSKDDFSRFNTFLIQVKDCDKQLKVANKERVSNPAKADKVIAKISTTCSQKSPEFEFTTSFGKRIEGLLQQKAEEKAAAISEYDTTTPCEDPSNGFVTTKSGLIATLEEISKLPDKTPVGFDVEKQNSEGGAARTLAIAFKKDDALRIIVLDLPIFSRYTEEALPSLGKQLSRHILCGQNLPDDIKQLKKLIPTFNPSSVLDNELLTQALGFNEPLNKQKAPTSWSGDLTDEHFNYARKDAEDSLTKTQDNLQKVTGKGLQGLVQDAQNYRLREPDKSSSSSTPVDRTWQQLLYSKSLPADFSSLTIREKQRLHEIYPYASANTSKKLPPNELLKMVRCEDYTELKSHPNFDVLQKELDVINKTPENELPEGRLEILTKARDSKAKKLGFGEHLFLLGANPQLANIAYRHNGEAPLGPDQKRFLLEEDPSLSEILG